MAKALVKCVCLPYKLLGENETDFEKVHFRWCGPSAELK